MALARACDRYTAPVSQAKLPRRWTVQDSRELYNVTNWSNGYFGINDAGHLVMHPEGAQGPSLDVKELVDEVGTRGIGLPLLIRFSNILKSRIVELNEAFRKAIADYGYGAPYKGVYPIKVNQHKYIVEEIVHYGRQYHYGLEAGSKPELLAVMAMLDDPEALVVCNGYKDEEYVESALYASKLGRTVIMVVEKMSELALIRAVSERTGIKPRIGMRAKLATRGSGHWEASGGDRSKFGLTAQELMEAIAYLREHGMLDSFELLHFHLGSQISAIRSVKDALREAVRFYCELHKLGVPLQYLDVGGGLGIDYDGSQTNFQSSMNYSMQEYANDIVFQTGEMCNEAGVPHPTLVSESGRAVVAHHSILVVDVLGVGEFNVGNLPDALPATVPPTVRNLWDTYRDVTRKNVIESYHDAVGYKDESLTLFSLGHLSLEERVLAEKLFWATCQKVQRLTRELAELPEELAGLERLLSDTYFCNFSMFQSVPDSWAIDMLFPIMPIHRLEEEPTHRAVLADITCDSDGKIDHFIDRRDVKSVLELHSFVPDKDYHLGIFLIGAYQEILGDLHNLFGDTNTVHVSLEEGGGYRIDHVVAGDTVTEVLNYVSYSREDLVVRVRRAAEDAVRAGRMTLEETRRLVRMYEGGLSGYTYLERD